MKYQEALHHYCAEQSQSFDSLSGKREIILDPHQQEAMDLTCLALETNQQAFSIVHSCGTGKTILEVNILLASQRARELMDEPPRGPDLILTTQRALICSVRDELLSIGLDVGVWGNKRRVLDRPILLSTIHALQHNRRNLEKILPLNDTPLIIGDEADQFLTEARKKIIQRFPNALRIGLTATPTWPDGRDIEELWGEKIHEMKLKEGILNGINVPPLFHLFEAQLDDSELTLIHGDYDKKTLAAGLKAAEIQKAIPEVYDALIPQEKRKNYPTLVFVPSVDLVHSTRDALIERFSDEGIVVCGWTGEGTSSRELQNDIEAFNNGEIDVLILCEMGGRGVNLPRARCLIDAYPTLSGTKLEQRHGRVLRRIREDMELHNKFEKPFALIAQIIPKANKYRPYLLPDLLDCWPDFRAGRLLGIRQGSNPGNVEGWGEVGAPSQEEIRAIKQRLIDRKPNLSVRQIEEINIYEQLSLREELPQADEIGFFELDGELYGHLYAWSKIYTDRISASSIRNKTKNAPSLKGVDAKGRTQNFYSDKIIKRCLSDLLFTDKISNEDDFLILGPDNERHATITQWAKEFKISRKVVDRKLHDCEGVSGKDNGGRVQTFYAESTVKEMLDLHLDDIPKANEDLFFVDSSGERHATKTAWAKLLSIPYSAIKRELSGIKGETGKDKGCRVHKNKFYPESLIKDRLSPYLEVKYKANEDGTFVDEAGKTYATASAWAKKLGIASSTLLARMKQNLGITALDASGKIREHGFFEESLVREMAMHLLEDIPHANKNGFIIDKSGERYATKRKWSTVFKVANSPSWGAKFTSIQGITGRASNNQIYINGFYPESEVVKLFAK